MSDESKLKSYGLRLDDELRERLEAMARAEDRPVSRSSGGRCGPRPRVVTGRKARLHERSRRIVTIHITGPGVILAFAAIIRAGIGVLAGHTG
jgi:hypothetical protein